LIHKNTALKVGKPEQWSASTDNEKFAGQYFKRWYRPLKAILNMLQKTIFSKIACKNTIPPNKGMKNLSNSSLLYEHY
jgi:hypothetical protein